MVNLYLIRHGRQDSPLCNVDVGLSKEGVAQAKLLRERLLNYHIDSLYSSNLIRAYETANIINVGLQLSHLIRDEIREISFGQMEGKTEEYNEEHFKDFKIEQRKLEVDLAYPGGENGEDVFKRAMPVLEEIVSSGCENAVIVTHGGTIRALCAGLFGYSQAKRFLFATSLENTSITQISYEPQLKRFYLERFNDYAHLEGRPELHRRNR